MDKLRCKERLNSRRRLQTRVRNPPIHPPKNPKKGISYQIGLVWARKRRPPHEDVGNGKDAVGKLMMLHVAGVLHFFILSHS